MGSESAQMTDKSDAEFSTCPDCKTEIMFPNGCSCGKWAWSVAMSTEPMKVKSDAEFIAECEALLSPDGSYDLRKLGRYDEVPTMQEAVERLKRANERGEKYRSGAHFAQSQMERMQTREKEEIAELKRLQALTIARQQNAANSLSARDKEIAELRALLKWCHQQMQRCATCGGCDREHSKFWNQQADDCPEKKRIEEILKTEEGK